MMKHKLLTLFVALIATTALWAENIITYTAVRELTNSTLDVNATTFGPAIISHEFFNGVGTITCSGEITTIGYDAFYGCRGLISITIPNSITTIGDGAFYSCTNLKSITIPNSVTTIGNDAFFSCDNLTSVTIPNSVTTIGREAFSNCSGLTSPVYNANCFAYMPKSYKGAYSIPDDIRQIADCAFFGCRGLTSITIPNSVTTIGNDAFYNCSGLTSVTIPNSVTTIGREAFENVNNIVYSGTASGSPWGAKCVNGYVDGYLVYSDTTKTILCGCSTAATGEIIIPNSVMKIGKYAFLGCRGLTSIQVTEGNTKYDSRNNCNALIETATNTLIVGGPNTIIPNSVTKIGSFAFNGCSGLTSITIPNSVMKIGGSAFQGCSGLTSIIIPNSVTTIGYWAFDGCSGLTSITCYATIPPTCRCDCSYGIDKSIPIYVPANSVDAYKNTVDWKNFTNILPIAAEKVTERRMGRRTIRQ